MAQLWPLALRYVAIIIASVAIIIGISYGHDCHCHCHLWPFILPEWGIMFASLIASLAIVIAMHGAIRICHIWPLVFPLLLASMAIIIASVAIMYCH